MSGSVRLGLADAEALATAALVASRVSPGNARATARALAAAEADGQAGHGLSRVPAYALQARAGKVDGYATPVVRVAGAAALRVDAGLGFAYPAIDLAIEALTPLAHAGGIAIAVIHRSHHFGQAGAHAERLADRGLIGVVLGNTPKAMAFWGGREARLGTNPIAFGVPLPGNQPPLVVDLALSVAARGKIVAAEKAGRSIPPDWAVDAQGQPTTDPKAALAGTLLPIGGAKGAALALMVELLAAGLAGSSFGWEASSFFDDKGGPPNMGHLLVALDPTRLSAGQFESRAATLLESLAAEPGARMPGSRRIASRAAAARDGVQIPTALHDEILQLMARPT